MFNFNKVETIETTVANAVSKKEEYTKTLLNEKQLLAFASKIFDTVGIKPEMLKGFKNNSPIQSTKDGRKVIRAELKELDANFNFVKIWINDNSTSSVELTPSNKAKASTRTRVNPNTGEVIESIRVPVSEYFAKV